MTSNGRGTFVAISSVATGVSYTGSMVKMADVTDGASNTYMLGEKYVNPDWYTTGQDLGDNESAMGGDNEDIARWTGFSEGSPLLSADARHARQRRTRAASAARTLPASRWPSATHPCSR